MSIPINSAKLRPVAASAHNITFPLTNIHDAGQANYRYVRFKNYARQSNIYLYAENITRDIRTRLVYSQSPH